MYFFSGKKKLLLYNLNRLQAKWLLVIFFLYLFLSNFSTTNLIGDKKTEHKETSVTVPGACWSEGLIHNFAVPLCPLLETSRRKSRDKPLLRERLWELGVMRTEKMAEGAPAGYCTHACSHKTDFLKLWAVHTTAGRAFLSRLSYPLGDTRKLCTMKRECLFANRQDIPSLCYITSTSSVVKDKNHVLLCYFKTGWFIYSGFHKASANY